jgi:hypothetical protein
MSMPLIAMADLVAAVRELVMDFENLGLDRQQAAAAVAAGLDIHPDAVDGLLRDDAQWID